MQTPMVKVFANMDGICKIQNNIFGSLITERIEVTLKKRRLKGFIYELQIPIQMLANTYPKKNKAIINITSLNSNIKKQFT